MGGWDGVNVLGAYDRPKPQPSFWELYQEWVQQVGPPLVVKCDIDLDTPSSGFIYRCRSHHLGFQERQRSLSSTMMDRCPVSRLEEWRARVWEATA